LLLKAAAEAPRGITIYGQEKDNATWALSKMNMILHGSEDADIQKGDTLTSAASGNVYLLTISEAMIAGVAVPPGDVAADHACLVGVPLPS
jgi:type I restriction-modification system DNA methylase subunit